MDVEKLVREYLSTVLHMSLGTSRNNKPWVCEVHYAYDEALNLYWRSLPTRRHSEDIALNSRVAGNIVRQHGPDEKPMGVYFEGTAEMITDRSAQEEATQAIRQRSTYGGDILSEAQDPAGHQFYKVSVEKFYVFGIFEGKGQKLELPWN